MRHEDAYLGDGVYAKHDGTCIWLDLRGQDNTTQICLEPEVLDALNSYANRPANDWTRDQHAAHTKWQAKKLIEQLAELYGYMPHQGDKEEDSQKVCLLNAINHLSACNSGITPDDFKIP